MARYLNFHGTTLKRREVGGFALREIQHPPGVFIPKHSHENAHVGFILNGGFTEKFARKTLECRPLSVSYLSPGLTHTDDFRHGVHCLVFEIAPQRLERMESLLALKEPIFAHGGRAAWLTMRMYDEALQSDAASSLSVEGLALEILAELAQQQVRPQGKKPPRWLEQARELLHAEFGETLTHDAMARIVGVHPVHLATVFRRYFHCTIGEYVRRLRIEFASRQISASADSLCEIGLAAGFSDQSHFSKVFKNHTGMSPGRFRAHLRPRLPSNRP
jgi:AraC family transcriptional regulator